MSPATSPDSFDRLQEEFVGLHTPEEPTPESYADVPNELKAWDNWVCFRHKFGKSGKMGNAPYRIDGARHASPKDSQDWSTFADATQAMLNPTRKFDGISFMLLGTSYLGFDFDDVVQNERLDPFVASILRVMGDPYAEVSFSGDGLRVFINCAGLPRPHPTQIKKAGSECAVEIYHG